MINLKKTVAALEILNLYIQTFNARIESLNYEQAIPSNMRRYIASILYCNGRVNIKELPQICKAIQSHYGKLLDGIEMDVDPRISSRLTPCIPNPSSVEETLQDILRKNNVAYQYADQMNPIALMDSMASSGSGIPPAGGNSPIPPAGGNPPMPPAGGNPPMPPAGGNPPMPPSGGNIFPPAGGNAPMPPMPPAGNSPFPSTDNLFPPGGNSPLPPMPPTPPAGGNIFPPAGNTSMPPAGNSTFPSADNLFPPAGGNSPFSSGGSPFPPSDNVFPPANNNAFPPAGGNAPFPSANNNAFPPAGNNAFPPQADLPFGNAPNMQSLPADLQLPSVPQMPSMPDTFVNRGSYNIGSSQQQNDLNDRLNNLK